MIYDCFTFFNELDLLEIRLNVLNDVVDKFVLVEMDKTHTGTPKPFYFEENKKRYKKFLDKIIHIKITKYPNLSDSTSDNYGNKWILENYQRDKIMDALKDAKDDDIVIISDLDEIPNPDIIRNYDNSGIWVLEQKMFYYFINMLCYTSPIWSNGTRIGQLKNLKQPNQILAPCEFYEFSKYGKPTYFRFCQGKHIKNAGWHFSYCGGIDAIIKKRQSIVEQQFNTKENMRADYIKNIILSGKDLYNRQQYKYIAIPLDKSFPKYIVENQDKYKDLIFKITPGYRIKRSIIFAKQFCISAGKKILKFCIDLIPVAKWRKNLRKNLKNKGLI